MYNCPTTAMARKMRDTIIEEYRDVAEKAMNILDDGFESVMTVMALPKEMRRFLRTSNHLERLNLELKRRSKVIGIFPNTASLLRLMGSVLMEENKALLETRKARFSERERAALPACREELQRIAREQRKLFAA